MHKNGAASLLLVCLTVSTTTTLVSPPEAIQAELVNVVNPVNIVRNPSFENGLDNRTGQPLDWAFSNFEGVQNATVSLDSTMHIDGSYSAKVFVGPIACSPTCHRPIGFVQFYQDLPRGTKFANLTDSEGTFSFSFYLEPYGNSTGDFRARILNAEGTAELDYVFDPDPAVSYQNQSGAQFIALHGYPAGQWFNFTRNLRSDWVNAGYSLNLGIARVQFEGLAYQPPIRSETFWLDNVKLFAGSIPAGNKPPNPTFTFTPDTPVIGQEVTFNASASTDPNPNTSLTKFLWRFGDGSNILVSTNPVVGHTFNDTGTYRGSLTAYDSVGLSNSFSLLITVYKVPPCLLCPNAKIMFVPTQGVLVGTTVSFNSSASVDPSGSPLRYVWDFGDGSNGTGALVTHRYANLGTFVVRLVAFNNMGLSNSTQTTVTVSLLDVEVMGADVHLPFILGAQGTTQNVSAVVMNVGNKPAYVYLSFTLISDRGGIKTQFFSQPQLLEVRDSYNFSVGYNQPLILGRYLVMLTVFSSTTELAPGASGWAMTAQTTLAYRVIG